MSTCVYEKDLHVDIYKPDDIAMALRKAADKLEDQQETTVIIHIAGIDVVINADQKEVYVVA